VENFLKILPNYVTLKTSSRRCSPCSGMVKVTLTSKTNDKTMITKLRSTNVILMQRKSNKKLKKNNVKWYEIQKIPWHNIDECHSKQSLLVKLKDSI
jgi:hypothetical protein